MSEKYIKHHFDSIKKYANSIEYRMDDEGCTIESVLEDNAYFYKCQEIQFEYRLY